MNESNANWLKRLRAEGGVQNEALEALRDVLFTRLSRTFRDRAGVDDALLEDMTQESLIKTLENLDQFQGKSRFTTWATSIAVRVAITELRRRHWKDISALTLGGSQRAPCYQSPRHELGRHLELADRPTRNLHILVGFNRLPYELSQSLYSQ